MLVEGGVRGATVAAICRAARLSQGALFQHYATKQDLLVAAVERLYAAERASFRQSLGDTADLRDAVALLWRTFRRPAIAASLELWASCRTDPKLRERLVPALDAFWASLAAEAVGLFAPVAAGNQDFPVALNLVFAALQSAAIGAAVTGREPPELDRHIDYATALLRGMP